MLKLFLVFILSTLVLPAFARDLPDYLESMLDRSDEYFEIYARNSPAEIDDGVFDNSDRMLFAQVDQANGLDVIFSKDEIKRFRVKLVLRISERFDSEQLKAITRIGRHPKLNKKKAAKYFEVAREYRDGELTENSILPKL